MRKIFSTFLPLLFIPTLFYSQTSPDCSAVTIISATNNGTNTVATYFESNGIRNGNDYFGSTVYYPQNTTNILASIIIIPGYANYESSMQNWGPFLASHGIVCMTIGTNSIFDLVNDRKEALQDALISLKAENTRINSPLFNKLDTNRIALGGWSMGGGGAQLAAVEDSTIKAIIALCPWIDPAQITINSLNHNSPTLFFSGQIDAIAPTNTHANVHYNYTPNTTDKLLYEITLGGHTVANSPSGGQGEVGRMALSWLKKYLIEDLCYCPLLLDTPLTASVYQTNITCPNYGCPDSTATNYDPLADTDDGSCSYGVLGCTDSTATNYTPNATVDDGSCCGLQLDWDQIGDDIDGEATIDASGRAISYNNSGDIIAIGARWNDGAGIDAGHVRVYQYNGSAWGQLGQDIDGEHANDFSGHSLSINGAGDRVAIGAYGNDDNGTNAGHVRVYEYNGSAWIQLGQDIDGELANDFKGFKVDINEMGDRIVVGSYGNDDNGNNAGKTQVYHFDGVAWIQVGSNIYGTNPNDVSSKGLQINDAGNIIAIGSPANADNGTNSGQVRVFEFLNTDWVQMGQNLNGESNGDFSGAAISLNDLGNIIAIGAKRNDENGSNSGHVRVFQYSANSWIQIGQDIDGESVGDESGYSLSLNGLGNRIAIGSYLNSDNATESGHARVFYFDTNAWNQIGNDVDGEFANDWSGRSVALNNIGDKLAIGADLNDGNGAHSGHVRVFSYNTFCLEGCTDPLAINYDATATVDDGTCSYLVDCFAPSITGLFISDIIDDQVLANFDNMNTYDGNGNQVCRVDQIRIQYRPVGTNSWSQKNIASPVGTDPTTGICNSTQNTMKPIRNLTPATEYEWRVKVWYCGGGN
ncbi:FG-GAP repeat protein, partial [Flavobacteriales bacterium]|nr:FG-GAP repeat protein [Flavobacteriales bacterium]